jgi:FG-GAP-like repeat
MVLEFLRQKLKYVTKKTMKKLIILFLFYFPTLAQSNKMILSTNVLPGISNGKTKLVDIDNDGDLDCFISGLSSNGIIAKFFKNDSLGSMSEFSNPFVTGVQDGDVEFFDYDLDGDKDLIVAGSSTQTVLYSNNGLGLFSVYNSSTFLPVTNANISTGDLDGDLDSDIIITGFNSEIVTKHYINNGGGIFTENTFSPFIGLYRGSMEITDLDDDSDLDVVITGIPNGSPVASIGAALPLCKIYLNDSLGTFTELAHNIAGYFLGDLKIANVGSDSKKEIILSGFNATINTANFYTNIYYNYYNSYYKSEVLSTGLVNTLKGSISISDLNKDGENDIYLDGLIGGIPNKSANIFMKSNGFPSFEKETTSILNGVFQSSSAFGDLNGDGFDDLINSGENNNGNKITQIYFNNFCNTESIIDTLACTNYLGPNNVLYNSNGQYVVTIPNSNGCDSTITINLSIKNKSYSTQNVVSNTSFKDAAGIFHYASGNFQAIVPNYIGCDSIITYNLTLNQIPNVINFDVAPNLTSWLEDGLSYSFVEGTDKINGNINFVNSGNGSGISTSGSTSKLVFSKNLNLDSIWVKYIILNQSGTSQIKAYDSLGTFLFQKDIINNYSYQKIGLNWQNVRSISLVMFVNYVVVINFKYLLSIFL